MKAGALTGLKLLASLPLALFLGSYAGLLLEEGLWPLLFLPDAWLHIVDMFTQAFCQIVMFGALIWFWVLGR